MSGDGLTSSLLLAGFASDARREARGICRIRVSSGEVARGTLLDPVGQASGAPNRQVRGLGAARDGDGIPRSSKRAPGAATVARDALRPSRRTLRCSGFATLRRGERENPSSRRHRPDDRSRDRGRPRRFGRKGRQGVEDAEIADGGMNPALVAVKAAISSRVLRTNDGAFQRVGKRHSVCDNRRKKSLEKVDIGERYDEDLANEALAGSPRPRFVRN